jgi:hypothetical protein
MGARGPAAGTRRGPASSLSISLVAVALLAAGCSSGGSASSSGGQGSWAGTPGLEVSGTSNGWVFHDGQVVKVSMGANKTFVPYTRINILECANPGGTTANLPTRYIQCDGNTIQGDSIIVKPNGSFAESAYTVFKLPSRQLGESPAYIPVCDATHQCVLFVTANQNDFSAPKVFSHPFTVTSGSGS